MTQFLFDTADLGGDVGFADAENLGDLAVTAVFQVKQDQRSIKGIELVDKPMQQVHPLIRLGYAVRASRCSKLLRIECLQPLFPARRPLHLGNGDVERHAIHPG